MKRIATVTFHAAHNYGSVLQAYALQEFVKSSIGSETEPIEYAIINYRSAFQKKLYGLIPRVEKPKDLVKIAIRLLHFGDYKKKYRKFEDFIHHSLQTTEEVNEDAALEAYGGYDAYISGSDQIWNVRAKDYRSLYFLDFVKERKTKLSYAASCGPLNIDWSQYDVQAVQKNLKEFAALSVRESGTARMIEELTGRKCAVHADPTLLLSKEQWREVQSDANYRDGEYILLYCLEPSRQQLKIAQAVSEKLQLPILITKYNNKNDYFNSFVKRYDCGPRDFLSYIDHAKVVLTSSFHGTAFSIIYQKPFFALNGLEDNRISSLLEKTNLCARAVNSVEDVKRIDLDIPDFTRAEQFLKKQKQEAKSYLKRGLGIETEAELD